MIVKCKSVGSGNKLVNAEDICEQVKKNLQSNGSIKSFNLFGEIEDLDGGKAFKINIDAEKSFRLLKVTVDEIINEISKNLRVEARSVASVEVYNINLNGSVNTWNARNFKWKKSSNNASL